MTTPTPLDEWPLAERARIHGVLTDIDDTLTTDGALCTEARAALQALRTAGLPVFAVTGRPVGWSLPLVMQWPIDAIVAENGAVALWRNAAGELERAYQQDPDERQRNRQRLDTCAARIRAAMPHAQAARDSAGRETDIAIDHSEFAHLDETDIARVVALMQADGLNATVSSIHINGWIGPHDKLSGAQWIVRLRLGRELDAELDRWVYVGDSTNDARLFGHMPHSVGVANVRRFWSALTQHPRYVAPRERGAGFADVAQALLAARP